MNTDTLYAPITGKHLAQQWLNENLNELCAMVPSHFGLPMNSIVEQHVIGKAFDFIKEQLNARLVSGNHAGCCCYISSVVTDYEKPVVSGWTQVKASLEIADSWRD